MYFGYILFGFMGVLDFFYNVVEGYWGGVDYMGIVWGCGDNLFWY